MVSADVALRGIAKGLGGEAACTRCCYDQYYMVYSIQTGGRKGSLTLFNHRAIVYCIRVGNAGGRGGGESTGDKHNSVDVNEYLARGLGGEAAADTTLLYSRRVYLYLYIYIHTHIYTYRCAAGHCEEPWR